MMAFAMLLVGSGLVVNVADTVPRYDMNRRAAQRSP